MICSLGRSCAFAAGAAAHGQTVDHHAFVLGNLRRLRCDDRQPPLHLRHQGFSFFHLAHNDRQISDQFFRFLYLMNGSADEDWYTHLPQGANEIRRL